MRELIWNSMLTAQMNASYWNCLARRYYVREKWAKIFLAVTASGAVAGWSIWAGHPVTWKVLSGFSALLAVALPLLDYSGQVSTLTKLAGKCAQLRASYDLLWAQVDALPPNVLQDSVGALSKQVAELSEQAAIMPTDMGLLERCYDEVLKSRNLAAA